MARLIVDFDGKLTIPPDVIKRRGLQPGDQLALVESADGLLVYEAGVDRQTLEWWAGLSEENRVDAVAEARRYQALSDEERERICSESPSAAGSNAASVESLLTDDRASGTGGQQSG